MDLVLIGFGCVAALVVLFAFALCRAAGLADRLADRLLGARATDKAREEHYRACDSFAGWHEPTVELPWPKERAA